MNGPTTTTNEPALTPPLKWHGGKHYLAPVIHQLAERAKPYTHRVITHAGGLGELWGWECDGVSEVVNDLNGQLTDFWEVLADPDQFPAFLRIVQATPFSEEVYHRATANLLHFADGIRVQRAAWFFISCRQSMAGRMNSFAPLSRTRTRRGMNEQASSWLTAIDGLPAVHERLKRVVILNRNATDCIKQQDGPATLFYVDPPYVPKSRTAPNVYRCEMTIGDHAALLQTLATVQGKFILSGYDCDLYRDHEAEYGWKRQEVELPNNAASGDAKRRMIEVLWSNF